MLEKYKICFLAYQHLVELAQEVISETEFPNATIDIVDCTADSLAAAVAAKEQSGFNVFIAGFSNAAEFRRRSKSTLIELQLQDIDYLAALSKAFTIGNYPLFVYYRYAHEINTSLFSTLLGTPISAVTYENRAELINIVQHTEADVIIGASHSVEVARLLGKKHVLVSPSKSAIVSAIRQAIRRAQFIEADSQNQEIIRNVISQTSAGIIVTDRAGQITLFNQAAQTVTGYSAAAALGRELGEVVPPLGGAAHISLDTPVREATKLINGAMIQCRQVVLSAQGNAFGLLTVLSINNMRKTKSAHSPQASFTVSGTWEEVISSSDAMSFCCRTAKSYARVNQNVCILGEPATGKMLLAECIHNSSERAASPCAILDLSILPDQSLLADLLGEESGETVHHGLLELISRGTIILKGLSQASDLAKRVLSQVLSHQALRRVNGRQPYLVDLRFITLMTGEETGALAPFYDLSVLSLETPPLRDRAGDLPMLFEYFFRHEYGSHLHSSKTILSKDMKRLIAAYSWPGNIAELRRCCARYATALTQNPRATPTAKYLSLIQSIGLDTLFFDYVAKHPALQYPQKASPQEFKDSIEEIKQLLLINNSAIAEKIGLSRTTLWRYLNGDAKTTL